MRTRIIVVVATLGLLLSAGIASADDDESDPRGDTLFNYGYDPQAQLFLHGTTDATESSVRDCTLANGALTVTYGTPDEGIIPVDVVGTTCAISAVPVGANGHINHGTFMKLFNELIDMHGHGCLNRWLAKSELGKNDLHVNNTDFVVAEIADGDTGDIDFETATASCDRGKKDKPEDHPGRGHTKADKTDEGDESEGNGKGRPESPGNSDKAPGHNKES